jgi:hypothetical protein
VKSTTCLQTLRFNQGSLGGVSELVSPGVTQILSSPTHPHQFLVINRSGIAYTLDSSKYTLVRVYKQDQNTDPKNKTKPIDNFAAGAASPHGRFTYLATEHGSLCMYKTESGEFVDSFPVTENGREIIGLVHHPFANVLVSFDEMGLVKVWRP